ncbi:MAG: hypothetical protein AAF340_00815 [Pseudomonadota bacterium]
MVGDNKILTVSYGTFSCTLEGFDDPFSTMKAIAEYFRDLAAEDRFFGAEPPQPDADMLHRIAEQTIQSRVNAEVTDNSLVLRQDHDAAPIAAAAAMTQAAPEPAPVAEVAPAPTPAAPLDGDSIAAKLQRIRSVVAQEAQASPDAAQFYSEDEHADTFASAANAPVEEPVEDVTEETVAEEAVDVAEPEMAADVAEDMPAEAPAEDDVEVADEADTAKVEEVEAAQDAAAELEAEDSAPELYADAAETETSVEDTVETEADEVAELDDDTIASALEALDEADESAEDSAENIFEEATPRRRIVVQKISREDVEAAQQGDTDALETADLSEEAEAALMRELADVEADIEDATAQDSAETEDAPEAGVSEDAVAPELETASEDTSETGEKVEDAETAAVDTTEEVEDAVLASEEDQTKLEEARAERVARRSLIIETEDAALNRLMDATRTRMSDDGEGAVRRASIAHLKAAVAATKADDSIVRAAVAEEERELDQYRDDLARVVRPVRSRAVEGVEGEARPKTLMLVSEQRVEKPDDEDAVAAEADVRPRRVATAGNLALDEEFEEEAEGALQTGVSESFTDFAKRYKAMELPDLLEAAAAHYAYVEKTEEFTRPMLMRKISTLSLGDVPSREDGLRCFGALLRDDKIIRSGNGKFVLSETSRFAPEAQSAAG